MSKLFPYSLYFMSFLPLWVSVLFIEIRSIFTKEPGIATEIGMIVFIFCWYYSQLDSVD